MNSLMERNHLLEKIAAHSAARISNIGKDFSSCSGLFITADLQKKVVRKKNGRPAPYQHDGKAWTFTGSQEKVVRNIAVLDEMCTRKDWGTVHIDMQDARSFGIGNDQQVLQPVICYCRKIGAKNIALWPLPGYHKFAHQLTDDSLKFEEKIDKVVWRGNISGYATCEEDEQVPTFKVIENIRNERSNEKALQLWEYLFTNLRFKTVIQRIDDESFDVGLVVKDATKSLFEEWGMCKYLRQKASYSWIVRHKYVLSLRGYDTGSNFIEAANSNSVVFKEEDGWELFYTSVFKAWEHYIPVSMNLTDLDEKLDWARSNQKECADIAHRSKKLCSIILQKSFRQEQLDCVLLDYILSF